MIAAPRNRSDAIAQPGLRVRQKIGRTRRSRPERSPQWHEHRTYSETAVQKHRVQTLLRSALGPNAYRGSAGKVRSGHRLEIATPALGADRTRHDFAPARRQEVDAAPAALSSIRDVLIARDGFRHVPTDGWTPCDHWRGGRPWRRRGNDRRRRRHAARERTRPGNRSTEQRSPHEGAAGHDRTAGFDQRLTTALSRHVGLLYHPTGIRST
jgi:hypothetical protein